MQPGVSITGMGIVSAIGQGVPEYERALRKSLSGIGFLKFRSEPSATPFLGAEIRDFQFENALQRFADLPEKIRHQARTCAGRAPHAVQVSLMAGLEAWQQAALFKLPGPHANMALVVAGHNFSNTFSFQQYEKFLKSPQYVSPRHALHYMDTDMVGTISEVLGLQGEGLTAGGASASGNVGIIKGLQLIQLGEADVCVVVGGLADLAPVELQAYANLGALGGKRFKEQPHLACRPFDREHEGFIYGQAAGCLILEESGFAQRRGACVLARLLGGAIRLDANRLSDPHAEGEVRAMRRALRNAGRRAEEVDYLNTHGSSSPLGDETEVAAIKRVFEGSLSRLWINSTKSLTGHCLYSAGVVEAIATIIQMREGFIHSNLNLEHPIDSACRFSGPTSQAAEIRLAMSNSFGFGGINTSIVLEKG